MPFGGWTGRIGGTLVLTLSACAWPAPRPIEGDRVVGQVTFPVRQVQASFQDVAEMATVSLIEPASGQTRTTTLTDAQGRFSLSFGGITLPDQFYYLEAVKGLDSHRVGSDAARVRTLLKREKGQWSSLTGLSAAAPVGLGMSTTAVCIIASLRPAGLTLGSLLGSVALDATETFTPAGTGIPVADFNRVRDLANQALQRDHDPFDAIQLLGGAFQVKAGILGLPPSISSVQPAMAAVGSRIALVGSGFEPSVSSNAVRFSPGVTATVVSATSTRIEIFVPSGASTGELVLDSGLQSATASFTLVPLLDGRMTP
jgi:hypothetical protein